MKINSLILFHIRKLVNLSYYPAIEYMIANHFTQIGSGCESVVFTKKGFDYVIKLQHSPFFNTNSSTEVPCTKHFANQKAFAWEKGGGSACKIIVQEKVDQVFGSIPYLDRKPMIKKFSAFTKFLKDKFEVRDTHDGNIGLIKGRFVVFDWTVGEG